MHNTSSLNIGWTLLFFYAEKQRLHKLMSRHRHTPYTEQTTEPSWWNWDAPAQINMQGGRRLRSPLHTSAKKHHSHSRSSGARHSSHSHHSHHPGISRTHKFSHPHHAHHRHRHMVQRGGAPTSIAQIPPFRKKTASPPRRPASQMRSGAPPGSPFRTAQGGKTLGSRSVVAKSPGGKPSTVTGFKRSGAQTVPSGAKTSGFKRPGAQTVPSSGVKTSGFKRPGAQTVGAWKKNSASKTPGKSSQILGHDTTFKFGRQNGASSAPAPLKSLPRASPLRNLKSAPAAIAGGEREGVDFIYGPNGEKQCRCTNRH